MLAILSSCDNPPDVAVCVDLTDKGFCTYTISDKEFYVTGNEWEQMKIKSLVLPSESWQEIKKYLLEQCKKSSKCMDKIETIQKKSEALNAD